MFFWVYQSFHSEHRKHRKRVFNEFFVVDRFCLFFLLELNARFFSEVLFQCPQLSSLHSRTHALVPLLKWRRRSNGLESWLVYTCSNFLQQVNENIFLNMQCQLLALDATDRSSKLSPFSNVFVASSNLSHFVLFTFYTWVNALAS